MKYILAVPVLVAAAAITGCMAPVDAPQTSEEEEEEEDVADVAEALQQTDTMGSYPWASQAGWTSDTYLYHQVNGISGAYVNVEAYGNYPQYTGAYTAQKAIDCTSSTLRMILYKRATSSDAWTWFVDRTVHAVPEYGTDSNNNFIIVSCSAATVEGGCGSQGIHFVTSNQMQVRLYDGTPNNTEGQKVDVVRRTDGEWCSP